MDDEKTLVVDIGSGVTKIGFPGKYAPSSIFPSIIGQHKFPREFEVNEKEKDEYLVGKAAFENRGILKLKYPINHSIISDWDDYERLLSALFETELNITSEGCKVVLVESPLSPTINKVRTAKYLFESLRVEGVCYYNSALMSLHSCGTQEGLVLECGDGCCTCTPIIDSRIVQNYSVNRIDIGGRDVTTYLQRLLRLSGVPLSSSAEFEVVRDIKEKTCYISPTPLPKGKPRTSPSVSSSSSSSASASVAAIRAEPAKYVLPDRRTITVDEERSRAPEILFNPSIIGSEEKAIGEMVYDSLLKCPSDNREQLCKFVLICGGSSLFPGFPERLLFQIRSLMDDNSRFPLKLGVPKMRECSAWNGAAQWASMAVSEEQYVLKEQYEEQGEKILHEKFTTY